MSEVLDDRTPLPRVTIGFFLGFVALVIAGTQFKVRQDDVADRQAKYIERRDAQHAATQAELEELHDRYDRLCQEIAARWSEVVCD